jgi:hypothetical protein
MSSYIQEEVLIMVKLIGTQECRVISMNKYSSQRYGNPRISSDIQELVPFIDNVMGNSNPKV